MAKSPAFQFYPGDWLRNAALRRCTAAERGVWIDVLCLMHDAEERGVLRWPLKDIAQAVGCRLADLRGLIAKGVLKGAEDRCPALTFRPRHAGKDGDPVTLLPEQDGPLWYSSRMVRDQYVADRRAGIARSHITQPKGTPDGEPMQTPNPPIGDLPSSAVAVPISPSSLLPPLEVRAGGGSDEGDGDTGPRPHERFRQRWDSATAGYAGDDRSAPGKVAAAIAQREADRRARGE